MKKTLAFAGSLRKHSFNKQLVKIAAAGARKAGAHVDLIDLADYPLPIYNADEEAESGLPENAKKLKKLFLQSDGFLIASPEYNSSISGVLKNAIDWVSRPEPEDPHPLVAFVGKRAAVMSASPSQLGGLRGLFHLREILLNIRVTVLPDMVTVPSADQGFNTLGQLKDPVLLKKALQLGVNLYQSL